jgi:hypothetical protein
VTRSGCHRGASSKEPVFNVVHAGLDLSRRKLDVCLLSDEGEHLDQLAVAPDVDSLRTLAKRIDEIHSEPVCAVIESMTGAGSPTFGPLDVVRFGRLGDCETRCAAEREARLHRFADHLAGFSVRGRPGMGPATYVSARDVRRPSLPGVQNSLSEATACRSVAAGCGNFKSATSTVLITRQTLGCG